MLIELADNIARSTTEEMSIIFFGGETTHHKMTLTVILILVLSSGCVFHLNHPSPSLLFVHETNRENSVIAVFKIISFDKRIVHCVGVVMVMRE